MNNLEGHTADYELLGKYLAGECNSQELAEVELWLREPGNAAELEALREFWTTSEVEEAKVDTDAAWSRVHGRMNAQSSMRSPRRIGRRMPLYWAAAALLVVAVGFGVFFMRGDRPVETPDIIRVANTGAAPKAVQLPDGSEATLNVGASISYAEGFASELREVQLEGEAFFDVTKNPDKAFVVLSGGAEVRVLGTSFSVSTEAGMEVKVKEGTVMLSAPESKGSEAESVTLKAGMEARYDEKKAAIVDVKPTEENDLFWKTRRLTYEGEPLVEVVEDLREFYQVEVELASDAIHNCPLNANFYQEDIESIFQIISESFDLTVKQDGNKFTINGDGC